MTIAHPMRKLALTLALVALAAPAAASAQAQVSIQIGLPVVLPPLVVVEPGVQVVQGVGEEVFFVDGYYWARRGDWWYRAHDHRARWAYVEPRFVPAALVRIPPGYYRHWHGEYRYPHWLQERRHPHWYQERAYRQWRQEDEHPRWHQGHGRPDWHQERGEAGEQEWREARWEGAHDHQHGRGQGHHPDRSGRRF